VVIWRGTRLRSGALANISSGCGLFDRTSESIRRLLDARYSPHRDCSKGHVAPPLLRSADGRCGSAAFEEGGSVIRRARTILLVIAGFVVTAAPVSRRRLRRRSTRSPDGFMLANASG